MGLEKRIYCFKVMAKCMTIDEFHRLPEDVQEKYLTWSMEQFLRERHAILIERAGGCYCHRKITSRSQGH